MHSFATLRSLILSSLAALMLSACGGESENKDLADLRVFKNESPYADVIADCARAQRPNQACSLFELPVLGMDFNDPGIAQIMERVVVSHDWMGMRFEEILYELPSEMLPLFKGITAIVIDDDVRPAYYTSTTGAIYLDPAFLWLSEDEKLSINPKQDYRAGFDDPLAFRQLQRYLKDGQPAYKTSSLTDDSTRELKDILLLAARLLLHELAHANDFIPPDSYHQIDPSKNVSEAASSIRGQWLSTRLNKSTPLMSDAMFSLADVMYLGATPTIDDLEVTASDVGAAFEPDGAGDDYGYTTPFEDLAMLFEISMMKHLFDADYEIAFTGVPENPESCDNYIIGWGVRNRVAHPQVKPRAKFVVEQLLPSLDTLEFLADIESPTEISGDWCISVNENEFTRQKLKNSRIDPLDRLRPYL